MSSQDKQEKTRWYPAWPCVIAGMLLSSLLFQLGGAAAQPIKESLLDQMQEAASTRSGGGAVLFQLLVFMLVTLLAPFFVAGLVVARFGNPSVPQDVTLTGVFSSLILVGWLAGNSEGFAPFGVSMATVNVTVVVVGVLITKLGGKVGYRWREVTLRRA